MELVFSSLVPGLVEKAMSRYRVPGIVVSAVTADGRSHQYAAGQDAAGQPLTPDSLFPVASITKLASALVVLRLVDAGKIGLDEPIARLLADAAAAQPDVTTRTLLAHSGGLPYEIDDSTGPLPADEDWPRLAVRCLQTPLERPPTTRVRYSNVGYGLLALMVERALGIPFKDALTDLVLRPLGVDGIFGGLPDRRPVTLTDVRGPRAGTEYEPFNTPFWYGLALPWSGLLTTAAGAIQIVDAYDSATASLIRPETACQATQNQNGDLPGGFVPPLSWKSAWWGLGPDLRDGKAPHWTPENASPNTYGHAGASGSLAYRDPARGISWSILGTRTADNGWLLLAGPSIGSAILDAVPRPLP